MKLDTPWGSDCMIDASSCLLKVKKTNLLGVMIERSHAEKHLSDYTLSRGNLFGHYYCYEQEDIPLVEFEFKNLWSTIAPRDKQLKDANDIFNYYIRELSTTHADYLCSLNIVPIVVE